MIFQNRLLQTSFRQALFLEGNKKYLIMFLVLTFLLKSFSLFKLIPL